MYLSIYLYQPEISRTAVAAYVPVYLPVPTRGKPDRCAYFMYLSTYLYQPEVSRTAVPAYVPVYLPVRTCTN